MKEYELTVLIHPDLEADLNKALGKVKSLITDNGGEIIKEDNWGKKRLAYQINREDFAIYVYFRSAACRQFFAPAHTVFAQGAAAGIHNCRFPAAGRA